MRIEPYSTHYFSFKLDAEPPAAGREFIAELCQQIPGQRRYGRPTGRFYLEKERMFCVHESQFKIFARLVLKYFGRRPSNPMRQRSLF